MPDRAGGAALHRVAEGGVPVEFVRYPGQSHLMPWGGPARYREDFYTRVLGWMEQDAKS